MSRFKQLSQLIFHTSKKESINCMPTFVLSVPELSTYWGGDGPISVLVSLFTRFIFSTAQRFSIKYCTKDFVL